MAITAEELNTLAAHPSATRRMYVACGCNNTGCVARHVVDDKPSKVCPECGDTGEAHYIMVSAASDGWPIFMSAKRGHDDDDEETQKAGLACEGFYGKALWETEEEFAARGGHR